MRTFYGAAINTVFALSQKKLKAKYTEGIDERQGIISAQKAALIGNAPIWIHAVSVGEVQAAVPFMGAARSDGYDGSFVISTTTQTGRAMAERLGSDVFNAHIYYPWDKRKFVTRALDTLRPVAFITTETELWPNMLWECNKRGIPSYMINGRISDRTWARIRTRAGAFVARAMYSSFSKIFLRDDEDKKRLAHIGIPESIMYVTGDNKIDTLLARKNYNTQNAWRTRLGSTRPTVIAGSTHTGEDEKILAAFAVLHEKFSSARLIIVPRHPERASNVLALAKEKFSAALLTTAPETWDVLVVDKIGVLFDLYGISDMAFVGGSFADCGGQNIYEPFSWGIPIQYGPHMEDFAAASREFISIGAADQVKNEYELAEVWCRIAKEDNGEMWRKAADEYFGKSRGASLRTWKIIKEDITKAWNQNG
ncbi:MAG: glycosyltransferase N-terminal domain-containing protein [Synergistes sp.]|nr:glycosyltransferase N-terminal domain-containing protein [Synergistes sp.]